MRRAIAGLLGVAAATTPYIASARSPVYGPPYRRGIEVDVGVGASACVPGGPGGGRCNPTVSDNHLPGFALSVTAGYRFNPFVFAGASYGRYGLTSGRASDGSRPFASIRTDAVYGVVRGILPFRRVDLGLELGLGWSRLRFPVQDPELGASLLESSGLSVRPALVYQHWVLADFFVGAKTELAFDAHTRFCSDLGCAPNLGPVPVQARDVFVHNLALLFYIGGVFSIY